MYCEKKADRGGLRLAAGGGRDCKAEQENLGDDGNVLCFDYGSGFKGVYMLSLIKLCTEMGAVYCK